MLGEDRTVGLLLLTDLAPEHLLHLLSLSSPGLFSSRGGTPGSPGPSKAQTGQTLRTENVLQFPVGHSNVSQ